MLQNIDTIHPQAKEWMKPLLNKITGQFKENVDSIYLYGDVVTDDYVPKQSTIQALILFDSFHFPRAKELQPLVKPHLKNGVIAPLCLSVETLERSTDTFPLEFIEIKEKHLHVYGETNRVQDLRIPMEYLRLKIEEQIKGKLIRLREMYMETGDQPKVLLEILTGALVDLVPVLRNLLRFLDEEAEQPPKVTKDVIAKLDENTDFSIDVLRTVWAHHQKQMPIEKAQALATYGEMADVLLELSTVVDRWQTKS